MLNMIPLINWICIAASCYYCAKHRGRDPYRWLIIGLLFGILGLIVLFIMPSLSRARCAKKEQSSEAKPVLGMSHVKSSLEPIHPSHINKLWYYLNQSREQIGPMSLNALEDAWKNGKITQITYVWNELMENWEYLEQVLKVPSRSSSS